MPIPSFSSLKHLAVMGFSMIALGLIFLAATPHAPSPTGTTPSGSALRRFIKPPLILCDAKLLPENDLYELACLGPPDLLIQ